MIVLNSLLRVSQFAVPDNLQILTDFDWQAKCKESISIYHSLADGELKKA